MYDHVALSGRGIDCCGQVNQSCYTRSFLLGSKIRRLVFQFPLQFLSPLF